MTRAINRLFPHPLLTLLLVVVWCLLSNQISGGIIVFGLILGTIFPLVTAAYWPDRPALKRPDKMLAYVLLVLWDVVVANFEVAWIVLTRPNARMHSTWLSVPLDLRTPEAITILAGTVTLTPGTVSSDFSSEGHCLLVHALDAADPDAVRDEIKNRYERRLKEIFE